MPELNLAAINYYANTATDTTIADFPTALKPEERAVLEQSGRISTVSGVIAPSRKQVSDIKSKLLQPALTSHYQCWFNPPNPFRDWLKKYKDISYEGNEELISLNCTEAALPGSSMMTNDINDDFTGVTERHAYRRQYDDRADFTFYVSNNGANNNYYIIRFFEYWLNYISGEEIGEGLDDTNYYYRVNYPKNYQSPALYVHKFEKDYAGKYLQYRLLQAYPISISSMPVSYESSQLLKCTVSFTYTRYVVQALSLPNITLAPPSSQPKSPQTPSSTSSGVPASANRPPTPLELSLGTFNPGGGNRGSAR